MNPASKVTKVGEKSNDIILLVISSFARSESVVYVVSKANYADRHLVESGEGL